MAKERIAWIDLLKGIGILTVVSAHIFHGSAVGRYAPWFHMALFLLVSGYLYKPKGSLLDFTRSRARHLLVPYLAYLVLLSIPGFLMHASALFHGDPYTSGKTFLWFTAKLLWGGTILGGNGGPACLPFGIFWFVTCLFFTQVSYNLLHSWTHGRLIAILPFVAVAYALAMLDSAGVDRRLMVDTLGISPLVFRKWGYPWCINVTLYALTYFAIGDACSRYARSAFPHRRAGRLARILLSLAVVITAVVLREQGVYRVRMGMKFAHYGLAGVNVLVAVSMIALLQELSVALVSATWTRPLSWLLTECGKASMVIMFLHTVIHMEMAKVPALASPWLRTLVSVAIPLILYRLFMKSAVSRRLFLGLAR